VTHATASNATQLSGGGSAETMGGPRLRKICFRRRVLRARAVSQSRQRQDVDEAASVHASLPMPIPIPFGHPPKSASSPPPPPPPPSPPPPLARAIFTRSAFSIAPHPAADAAIAIAKDARARLSRSLFLSRPGRNPRTLIVQARISVEPARSLASIAIDSGGSVSTFGGTLPLAFAAGT